MKKSTYLLVFFLFLFFKISFTQHIKINNKIEEGFYVDNDAAYFEGGFITIGSGYLRILKDNSNVFFEKEWGDYKLTLCKPNLCKPAFVNIINEKIIILGYEFGNKSYKIFRFTFDMQLQLIDEKFVAEVNIEDKGVQAQDTKFLKSPQNDYYIFARGLCFKDKAKSDKLEYVVFDGEFNKKEQNILSMPTGSGNGNDMIKNINSIFTLDDGTAMINYGGALFVLGEGSPMQLTLELEHGITSYEILRKNSKEIILIGTYFSGTGNEKSSGIAIITFDAETLEAISQTYTPVDEKFDTRTELFSNDGAVAIKHPGEPYLLGSQIDADGIIRIAISSHSAISPDEHGYHNIDILGMNANGEIVFEKVVPKRLNGEERNVRPITMFTENQTIIYWEEDKLNFDESGNYKFNEKTKSNDQFLNNFVYQMVYHFVVYDHEKDKYSNKKIQIKDKDGTTIEYDNKSMVIGNFVTSQPDEKYYFFIKVQPVNSRYGNIGKIYTLFGNLEIE
jgi:hypothetical protein